MLSYKKPKDGLCRNGETSPKIHIGFQRTTNPEKKNKAGELTFPDFKLTTKL